MKTLNWLFFVIFGISCLAVGILRAGDFTLNSSVTRNLSAASVNYRNLHCSKESDPGGRERVRCCLQYVLEDAGGASVKELGSFDSCALAGSFTAAQQTALTAIVKKLACDDMLVRFGKSCN